VEHTGRERAGYTAGRTATLGAIASQPVAKAEKLKMERCGFAPFRILLMHACDTAHTCCSVHSARPKRNCHATPRFVLLLLAKLESFEVANSDSRSIG
jgi:hypothetical protein